jgi:N-acetylglucosamine-6-sulfatase
VLIYQDDQDLYMGGWTPMKQTEELVAKQGMTASNWFIHTPVCCPSRGELLSGRYYHSIRVDKEKEGGCMHVNETKVNPVSFGHYLGEAGYTVGYFG